MWWAPRRRWRYRCGLHVNYDHLAVASRRRRSTAPILVSRSGSVKPSASSMTDTARCPPWRPSAAPASLATMPICSFAPPDSDSYGTVRPTASVRLQIRSCAVDLDLEGVAEHDAAQPLHLVAERVDVAQPGGASAVPSHHRAQQLRRPRARRCMRRYPLRHAHVRSRRRRADPCAPRCRDLQLRTVTSRSAVGRPRRGGSLSASARRTVPRQRGGDGVRCAARQLGAQVRDEPGGAPRLLPCRPRP